MKRNYEKFKGYIYVGSADVLLVTGIQAQTVTPSKKYITKELNNVSNFSSIRVLGSPDVEYRQSNGSKTTVSIYGSDNLVDLLEVSTVNGVLQVNIKKVSRFLVESVV